MRFFNWRWMLAATLTAFVMHAGAQSRFLRQYQARVDEARSSQPHWTGPIFTPSARIDQQARVDFVRQRNPQGFNTFNLGGGRGLQTIPFARTQFTLGLPPFLDHTAPKQKDGFGDFAFQVKYRPYARPEGHGNSIVTASLTGSIPTGKNGNGSCCALITPLLEAGKGWGHFDVISSASGTLPVSNTQALGRSVAWNTVAQYQLTGNQGFQFWVEAESNTTFYAGGPNDGKAQNFALPGITLRRIPLSPGRLPNGKRTVLSASIGMQIATTHFHTYNHAMIVALRVPF